MTLHPVASLVLNAARATLGEMEAPAYSNYHPTVTWYRHNVGDIGSHWNYCAAGVSREFGTTVAKPLLKPRAYVPWMMQDFIDGYAGGRLIWIDNSLSAVQPGDVVFFDWSKPSDGKHSVWTGNHVGVVESVRSNTEAITIEHNTSVPGAGNEGVARKVRDVRYIVAVGRPDYNRIQSLPEPPTIPGTKLPLLEIDGDMGSKSLIALSTVMNLRGHAVPVHGYSTPELTKAIQTELRAKDVRDREGKRITVDGKGFGSNHSSRYPKLGWTRTISACQIGHGVSRAKADGVFDKGNSSEVKRIQRDLNTGGVKDSPVYTG